MFRYGLTTLLFFTVFYCSLLAQGITKDDYIFKRITTRDGLSQSEVRAIGKDVYGFMWFGTTDGLNRYDGYGFKVYKHNINDSNTIHKSSIRDIYCDKKDRVWIGTIDGLALYDHKYDRFFRIPLTDSNDFDSGGAVQSIFEDSYGNLWFGAQGGSFRLLREQKNAPVKDIKPRFIVSTSCLAITQLHDSSIILCSTSSIAFVPKDLVSSKAINSSGLTIRNELAGYALRGKAIESVLEDKDGTVWIGTGQDGLWRYFPSTVFGFEDLHIYNKDSEDSHGLQTNYITEISFDSEDRIWVSSSNGLYRVLKNENNISFARFANSELNSESISHNNVDEIFMDDMGILWFGTMGGGVSYLDLNRKQFFKGKLPRLNETDQSSNFIRAIHEDIHKNIIFGTFDMKLVHLNVKTGKYTYLNDNNVNNALRGNQIFDIDTDSENKNNILVATIGPQGTISSIDYSDLTNPVISPLGNLGSSFSVQYFENELWKGGWNTFNKLTKDPLLGYANKQYPHIRLKTRQIQVDYKNNALWIGTLNSGLAKILLNQNNEPVANYYFSSNAADPSSINDNTVRDICIAKDGTLWAATDNGIAKVTHHPNDSTIKFKRYSTSDGLPSSRVQSLLEDNQGNLWISTVQGLSRLNPATETFKNFDMNDGLMNDEFVENSKIYANSGLMYFGNVNGYTFFNPNEIKNNPYSATPSITSLIVNNQEVKINRIVEKKVLLNKPIYGTSYLNLNWKHRTITFEFSAMHYASPKNNRYRYLLKGFEEEWIETSSKQRYVTYTNLPKGSYSFILDATNNDGEWTNNPVTVEIKVVPPFWRTTVFYIFIVLLVSLSVYRFFKYREKESKRAQSILEEKIKEGEKEIKKKIRQAENQKLELQEREERERELKYINSGLARFSDILGKNKNDVSGLAKAIVSELVRYINAEQGAIFILNDDGDNSLLEPVACFAGESEDEISNSFEPGEGLIGTCFERGTIIRTDDIPDNFISISSGLGKESPKHLLVVPILQDEIKVGVFEVSSFNRIERYKIDFLQRLCENIASAISIEKANKKAALLLEQNASQTEELRAQEEEMRQNIEEMMATQEENQRREEDYINKIQNLEERIEDLKEELNKSND